MPCTKCLVVVLTLGLSLPRKCSKVGLYRTVNNETTPYLCAVCTHLHHVLTSSERGSKQTNWKQQKHQLSQLLEREMRFENWILNGYTNKQTLRTEFNALILFSWFGTTRIRLRQRKYHKDISIGVAKCFQHFFPQHFTKNQLFAVTQKNKIKIKQKFKYQSN